MRVFFNLTSDGKTIQDHEGVEVASIDIARDQARIAVNELYLADPALSQDWEGWQMQAIDIEGQLIFTITIADIC